MDYLIDEFKKENGVDLSKDKMAMQRLKEISEKAKKDLSSMTSTQISAPFISQSDEGPLHLDMTLTRAKFEDLIRDLVESTLKPVRDALKDAKLTKDDIDKVIFVGGSTRIPMVYDLVKNELGKEPSREVNPDEVVAMGAAIQGGVLTGEVNDIVLLDVTPLSLGVETLGGVMTVLIPRNTTIPTSKKEVFSTAADNQPAVDIHILQGERSMAADNKTLGNFQLTGIPAAPRGVPQIEVSFDIDANGIVNVSAKDLGTNKSQSITITSNTNLTDEEIDRMRKEAEEHAEEDKKRKEEADLINEAEQLAFQTEKSIKDLGTNKSQSITITSNTNLTDDEIERMRKEAEEHAEEDKKRKEEADLVNEAEQLAFQTEKSIKDLGDKITEDEKKEAEDLVKELRDALSKDPKDIDDIKSKKDKLQEKAMALATKVYENVRKEQEANNANTETNEENKEEDKKDNVADADYEEK